jgi:monoamine oxidase
MATRFGIPLIDRQPTRAHYRYVADGRVISDAILIRDLQPIAAQIGRDAAAVDADYEAVAPKLDALSVAAYLDQHAGLLKPHVRALMEATIRTEFGAEPDQASAIELLFNLPVLDGRQVELISLSDERFILTGGSASMVKALAEPLMPKISTGHALVAIASNDGGLDLRFANGKMDRVDRVIVTVPAPLMRTIDYGGLLPDDWAALVNEMECGRNEKIKAGYARRVWDASSGQGGEPGVLTWFFGGDQVDLLMATDPITTLRRAEAAIAPVVPGLEARAAAHLLGTGPVCARRLFHLQTRPTHPLCVAFLG